MEGKENIDIIKSPKKLIIWSNVIIAGLIILYFFSFKSIIFLQKEEFRASLYQEPAKLVITVDSCNDRTYTYISSLHTKPSAIEFYSIKYKENFKVDSTSFDHESKKIYIYTSHDQKNLTLPHTKGTLNGSVFLPVGETNLLHFILGKVQLK